MEVYCEQWCVADMTTSFGKITEDILSSFRDLTDDDLERILKNVNRLRSRITEELQGNRGYLTYADGSMDKVYMTLIRRRGSSYNRTIWHFVGNEDNCGYLKRVEFTNKRSMTVKWMTTAIINNQLCKKCRPLIMRHLEKWMREEIYEEYVRRQQAEEHTAQELREVLKL